MMKKTKERISKGRYFVLKDESHKILGTILMTVENYFTNSHTAYLGQFGIQLDTAIPAKHLVEWYQRRGYKIVGQEHYEGKTYESYVFEKQIK